MISKIENEGKFLITDLIAGDESVAQRDDFNGLTQKQIKKILNLILNNKNLTYAHQKYLLENMWRVNHRVKPPTMDEFLSEKWLGEVSESVFPHVRKVLTEFYDPSSEYRYLFLAPHIGWGKSTATVLSNLFITVQLWTMRKPKKFFNLSPSTILVQLLISFTMEKAKELLLDPFQEILSASPVFCRCRSEESLRKKQKEYGDNVICYTTAGTHALQFSQNLNYKLASDPARILGITAVTASMSEISFFVDRGFSPEYIWRIFQDSKKRVWNRMKGNYYSRVMIDSSPNDIETSPIDKYIFGGEAYKDLDGKKINYVVTGAQWETFPDNFTDPDDTFPIYKGNAGKPAKILENVADVSLYTPDDIIWVPTEARSHFDEDLLKSIKDLAGWPSGASGKLIENFQIIEDMFYPHLNNLYDSIIAPANLNPKGLIWDKVSNYFFVKITNNHYEFYRSPMAPRYIAVDQSESRDITGIAMVHPELDKNGTIIIVTDFTIGIRATKEKINIESVSEFIFDLHKLGGIKFAGISFDRHQSSANKQRIERELDIKITPSGADIDINVYYTYISWLKNRRIKAGKNIFLKNNLKSLHEVEQKTKRKVEHLIGKLTNEQQPGANWKTDLRGVNAKDISDAHSMACFMLINTFKGIPRYQWTEYTYKENENKEKVSANKVIQENVLSNIYSKFNLQPAR